MLPNKKEMWRKKPVRLPYLTMLLWALVSFVGFTTSYSVSNFGKSCETEACKELAASILSGMKNEIDPCEEFYEFTCGNYMKGKSLSFRREDYMTEADRIIKERLRSMFEEPEAPGDLRPLMLAKKLYKSCKDRAIRRKGEKETIPAILEELGGWPIDESSWNRKNINWVETIYKLREMGFSADHVVNVKILTGFNGIEMVYLPQITPPADATNLDYEFLHTASLKLGLKTPDDNLISEMEHFRQQLRQLSSIPQSPKFMKFSELNQKYRNIPWKEYFTVMLNNPNYPTSDQMQLWNEKLFSALDELVARTPPRVIYNFIVGQALPFLQGLVDSSIFDADLTKDCLNSVERIGAGITAVYARKYIDDATLAEVSSIMDNLRETFIESMQHSSWMDQQTIDKGVGKIKNTEITIALAKEFLNNGLIDEYYSSLKFTSNDYIKMKLDVELFLKNKYYEQAGKSKKRATWYEFDEIEANGLNTVTDNAIYINPGILMGKMFNVSYPAYKNYAGVGVAVGHEFMHSVDKGGSVHNKMGYPEDWWSPASRAIYNSKTQCVVDQYNNYVDPEVRLRLNGVISIKENVADIGGFQLAYLAFKKATRGNPPQSLPGFEKYDANQMFWISLGHTWCAKYEQEQLIREINEENHSVARFRVNGPLSDSTDFVKDFRCKAGSAMNRPKKCEL